MKELWNRLLLRTRTPSLQRAEALYADGDFIAAGRLFRELALAGNAEAQLRLARLFEFGEGPEANLVEAARWYRAAANQGVAAAQARLGELLLVGVFPTAHAAAAAAQTDVSSAAAAVSALERFKAEASILRPDPEEALRWNEAAARAGDAAAEARLGYQYAVGLGTVADRAKAQQHFEAAARRGDASGQLGLGLVHARCYGGEADYAQAAHWLGQAADQGNATAKYCLAALSLSEHIPALEPERLLSLLTDAAEAKHPGAMFQLGEMYRLGQGVQVSTSDAETWLRRAAANDHVGAALSLARLLLSMDPPDLDSGAAFCRQAAEAGDGHAQLLLGQLYQEGRGLPRDAREAARWFERAADQGVLTACERLGRLYADDFELQDDFRAAADWFSRAAAGGSAEAIYQLGALQFEGVGVARDPVEAFKRFTEAAEKGSANAALSLGIQYASGQGVARDYAKAAAAYQRALDLGSREAAFNLAFLYLRGLGVEAQPERALQLLESAAAEHNVNAAWALHRVFADGDGVERDEARAAHWLVKAAELGSPEAAERLCAWLDTHEHTGLVADEVVGMLRHLAERGESHAQLSLSGLYREGRHVPADAEQAWNWLNRAAEAGLVQAQVRLGDAYRLGDGVAADPIKAAAWYERAAASGHSGALIGLTKVALELDPDGVDYEKLYKRWLAGAKRGDVLAQRMVGEYLLNGTGVAKSVENAVYWLGKAAEGGNDAAMVMLGGIHARGESGFEDAPRAVEWFTRAASAGNADAEYNLGICALEGLGMPRNAAAARQHFETAAARGSEQAAALLKSAGGEPAPAPPAPALVAVVASEAAGVVASVQASSAPTPTPTPTGTTAEPLRQSAEDAAPPPPVAPPAPPPVSVPLPKPVPGVHSVEAARRLVIDNRPEEALGMLAILAADDPSRIDVALLQCVALERLGRFDDAVNTLTRLLSHHPDNAEIHAQLGNTLYAAQRFDEARAALEIATQSELENFWAYINFSRVIELQQGPAAALASIRVGLSFAPGNPHVRSRYGRLLVETGQTQEGLKVLEDVATRFTDATEAAEFLVEHALAQEDFEAALRHSRRRLAAEPGNVGVALRHFMLLNHLQLIYEAESFVTANMGLLGNMAPVCVALARGFELKNQLDRAINWASRAQALDATHAELVDRLVQAKQLLGSA